MRRREADQILRDWFATTTAGSDPELQAVSNAVFLEETFGVTLTDAEIDLAVIGTVAGMQSVLARHHQAR